MYGLSMIDYARSFFIVFTPFFDFFNLNTYVDGIFENAYMGMFYLFLVQPIFCIAKVPLFSSHHILCHGEHNMPDIVIEG